jgi:hypothetical protein
LNPGSLSMRRTTSMANSPKAALSMSWVRSLAPQQPSPRV